MRPTITLYISSHGYGHATRDIEVIGRLQAARPDLRMIVRTSAPRRLFERGLARPIELHEIECDTGIAQIDSLRLDEAETIRRADRFHHDLDEKAAREAVFLRRVGAKLVVGDIPPLAFAAAAAADVPAVALGNFTWDWIYAANEAALAAAPGLVPTIRQAYSTATLALRLPMWGGFDAFGSIVRDVPFIARRSGHRGEDVRRALGLPERGPLVLLSFGGYGLDGLDAARLADLAPYTIVATVAAPVAKPEGVHRHGAALFLEEQRLYGLGYRYEDLIAAADVIVTKPGYGIIADAIANDTAILYTSRGRFSEYNVLVAAMPSFIRCRYIEQGDLLAGRWREPLDLLLAQPPPPERPATNGAEIVARIILDQLDL